MDLIDRKELLKRFELTSQANGNAIRYEIKCAPTVDAEPVRHGKWIDRKIAYICNRCRCGADRTYSYCPNCGAKMDLEGDNG